MGRHRWKHRSVFLLSLAISAGLVGCGGDSPSPKPDSQTEIHTNDLGFQDWLGDTLEDVEPEVLTDVDVAEAHPGDVLENRESGDLWNDGVEEDWVSTGCGFDYQFAPWSINSAARPALAPAATMEFHAGGDRIAHVEPPPPYIFTLPGNGLRDDITMPGYTDNMPLFARSREWEPGESRCYETPAGVEVWDLETAYEKYISIAETSTGVEVSRTPGVRTVVGLRGASPGQFFWNGNSANRFNDTLVLLWLDASSAIHVLEFPAHTDTGPVDFGFHQSSSLRPNRVYPYVNGWHRDYNALRIAIDAYWVRDDANKNGHWDSDRNGWAPGLPGLEDQEDHDRTGNAHNIHVASVDGPLLSAGVDSWSAGCQTVAGMANWTQFITHAWTGSGDPVNYHLVDVRDIDPGAFAPCVPDGSHECPFRIHSLPYHFEGTTSLQGSNLHSSYNCSPADESGPELVWVLHLQEEATLRLSLDDVVGDPGPDIDIHLLEGDDSAACIARGDVEVIQWVPPGRYLIIADTWVSDGIPLTGAFRLDIQAQE